MSPPFHDIDIKPRPKGALECGPHRRCGPHSKGFASDKNYAALGSPAVQY